VKEKVAQVLLDKKTMTVAHPKGAWLKLNVGETGFFRTAYSPELFEKLRQPFREGKLSELDRLGLVRDAFALAEGGVISTTEALSLALDSREETSYTVWSELSLQLRKISNLLADSESGGAYRKFASSIFEKVVKKVGWHSKAGESHEQTLLRSLILGNAGHYGDKEIVETAKKLFGEFLDREQLVSADLRSAVYTIGAASGGGKEFHQLLAKYRKESLHEEQSRIGHALASFSQKELLEEVLEFSLSKDVRAQDTLSIVSSVFSNLSGSQLAWEFVKKHWPIFLERYGSGGYALSRLIKSANIFHTREAYSDFKQFFKVHPAPGAARAVEQVLEKIDGNIRWIARDGKIINKWLSDKK
jgi:aminopeptidase N